MDPLSTHVLDTTSGLPGKGVNVTLLAMANTADADSWQIISEK